VTVTNSTNINKTNKKLSRQIIEHKETSTYDMPIEMQVLS